MDSSSTPIAPGRTTRLASLAPGLFLGVALVTACAAGVESAPHDHNLRQVLNEDGTTAIALLDRDGEEVARATAHHSDHERRLTVAMGDQSIVSTFDLWTATTELAVQVDDESFRWAVGEVSGDHVPGNAARYEELTFHWNNQFLEPGYRDWVNRPAESEAVEFRRCDTQYGATQNVCETECYDWKLGLCVNACLGLGDLRSTCLRECPGIVSDACEEACKDCPGALPPPAPPPPPVCWPCGCPQGPDVPCASDDEASNCANGCCFNDGC